MTKRRGEGITYCGNGCFPQFNNIPNREFENRTKIIVNSSDFKGKCNTFPINKGSEMYHTEKIDRPFSPTISNIGKLSNNLRRRAVFIGRQMHFLAKGNKKGEFLDLAQQFPKLAQKILKFMENRLIPELYNELCLKFSDCSHEGSSKLNKKLICFEYYESLYEFLKVEQVYLDLSNIYSPLPQQVLRYVADMWKSYYESLRSWYDDPSKFNGKPRIPNYNKKSKEFKFGIPRQYVASERYAKRIVEHYYNTLRTNFVTNKKGKIIRSYNTAELNLPPKLMKNFNVAGENFPPIRTRINIEDIKEIRFIPKMFYYTIEIAYAKQFEIDPTLDRNKALSIDIGVNITTALTTNFGTTPILINGRSSVKTFNQWMNKRVARLRSKETQGIVFQKGHFFSESVEIKRVRRKRNNFIHTHFHKLSRFIIVYCQHYKIGRIAIGYNTSWKQNSNLGKKNNQNFSLIPFFTLISMIKYKAKLVGIDVELCNEGYTSKCSALDFESVEYHKKYLGVRGVKIKGQNTKNAILSGEPEYKYYRARGLFQSKNGTLIHSDVNASFNIGRVTYPNLYNEHTLSVKNMTIPPISLEV